MARTRPAALRHAQLGHFDWFFGANPEIPRGIGYALGYELVSRYQARHGGASAASLWDTPAEAFRPD